MTQPFTDVLSRFGLRLAPRRRRDWNPATWRFASAITLVAALALSLLWIGDISWLQDDPRLLAKAFYANAQHTLATKGLNGNFGVPYGPLPTQIYQFMMLFTHDPLKIALMHAAFCAGVTALALIYLARALRLNPWFATAVVVAPYVWNFHRIMWDASYAVPIGSVALAAYATFLRRPRRASLFLTVGCVVALAFIHPQDAPLGAPIVLHMLWRRHADLRRHWVGIVVILLLFRVLNRGYFDQAHEAFVWQRDHGVLTAGYPGTKSRVMATATPLFGGSILGGYQFAQVDSQLREPACLVRAAQVGSSLVYLLIWLGIGVAVVRQVRRWRGRPDHELDDPSDPTLHAARQAIFGIVLVGLVLQMLLYGAMRLPVAPQYFFGTFVIQVLFAWIAVDALTRFRLDRVAIGVYGLSVAYITIASTIHIHRVGYDRGTFRPSLANQVEVARALNRYADQTVLTDVLMYKAYPQAIRSLRLLLPAEPGQGQTVSGRLLIRNRSGPSGTDSFVELVELPPGADLPKDVELLDVTPLPPNWEPTKW